MCKLKIWTTVAFIALIVSESSYALFYNFGAVLGPEIFAEPLMFFCVYRQLFWLNWCHIVVGQDVATIRKINSVCFSSWRGVLFFAVLA